MIEKAMIFTECASGMNSYRERYKKDSNKKQVILKRAREGQKGQIEGLKIPERRVKEQHETDIRDTY